MTEKKDRDMGRTREEWLALWEEKDWQAEVVKTLWEIATCSSAVPNHREVALGLWTNLIRFGLAPLAGPDDRTLPEVMRDVQLAIVRGRKMPLDEDLREQMAERLDGCRQVIETVMQFYRPDQLRASAQAASVVNLPTAGN